MITVEELSEKEKRGLVRSVPPGAMDSVTKCNPRAAPCLATAGSLTRPNAHFTSPGREVCNTRLVHNSAVCIVKYRWLFKRCGTEFSRGKSIITPIW